ncbi:MAG: type II toxin-antitoxin system RelE/ParE family toxin [Clostridia bacterium]|nr:type II toxin-antitoxin system RelE/ParE family toxin [Clostridia bacterium]
MNKKYKLQYLPLFKEDLEQTVLYISDVLQNPQSAEKLLDDVEDAIKKRLQFPLAFEPYHSARQRKHKYYKIQVRNFYVFYVVIDDVMEVRRFIYSKRDIDSILP